LFAASIEANFSKFYGMLGGNLKRYRQAFVPPALSGGRRYLGKAFYVSASSGRKANPPCG
jgi:hypothetical protein